MDDWSFQFFHLMIHGELPLPEDLNVFGAQWGTKDKAFNFYTAWSSCEVTKRVRSVIGITATIPKDFSWQGKVDGHRVIVYANGHTPKHTKTTRYNARVFFLVDVEHNGVKSSTLVPVGRIVQFFNGNLGKRS